MVSGERCWEGMRVGRPVTSGESAVCRHEQRGQNQGKTRPRTGRNELSDGQSRRRGFQTKEQQFMTPSATTRARNNPSLCLRGRRVLTLFVACHRGTKKQRTLSGQEKEVAGQCGTPRRCAKMLHRCPQPYHAAMTAGHARQSCLRIGFPRLTCAHLCGSPSLAPPHPHPGFRCCATGIDRVLANAE